MTGSGFLCCRVTRTTASWPPARLNSSRSLSGFCWWSRGGARGRGSQMLLMAEAEARNRGCADTTLNTYSFQAPSLYEGVGSASSPRSEALPRSSTIHAAEEHQVDRAPPIAPSGASRRGRVIVELWVRRGGVLAPPPAHNRDDGATSLSSRQRQHLGPRGIQPAWRHRLNRTSR